MNLLLDTHALIWWFDGARLGADAKAAIGDGANLVAVSAATVWEIAIKRSVDKLRFDGSIVDEVHADGFTPIAISVEHAERAGALPMHHRDPFDRMLIAQAQMEGLTIVTRDPVFDAYDVDVLRC